MRDLRRARGFCGSPTGLLVGGSLGEIAPERAPAGPQAGLGMLSPFIYQRFIHPSFFSFCVSNMLSSFFFATVATLSFPAHVSFLFGVRLAGGVHSRERGARLRDLRRAGGYPTGLSVLGERLRDRVSSSAGRRCRPGATLQGLRRIFGGPAADLVRCPLVSPRRSTSFLVFNWPRACIRGRALVPSVRRRLGCVPRSFSLEILNVFSLSMTIFHLCSYPFLWLFYFVGAGSAEPLQKGTLDGGSSVGRRRAPVGSLARGTWYVVPLYIYASFFSNGISNTLSIFFSPRPESCPSPRRSPSFLVFIRPGAFIRGAGGVLRRPAVFPRAHRPGASPSVERAVFFGGLAVFLRAARPRGFVGQEDLVRHPP